MSTGSPGMRGPRGRGVVAALVACLSAPLLAAPPSKSAPRPKASAPPKAAPVPKAVPSPKAVPPPKAVPAPKAVPVTAPSEPAPAPEMDVQAFDIRGNTLLSYEVITNALAPYKGRRTLAQLGAAALAVQQLYAAAGYGGVVAYLPAQQRGDGVLSIAVLEGRLARVSSRGGERHFGAANLRASLPALQVGATPRLKTIDLQLQMANENPAKRVQVLLKPGQNAGESDAEISVVERPPRSVSLGFDDTGNERTGRYRVSLGWQHANLSGRDDVLALQGQTSPTQLGRVRVLSAAYRFPLYAQLLMLDAYAASSRVDGGTTATAAGDLRFNGSGRIAGLKATRLLPRWGEADQRVSLGLDQRDYRNQCSIAGLPPGACGTAGASVTVRPLALEYSLQTGGATPRGMVLSLARNLRLGGAHADAASFAAARAGAHPDVSMLKLIAFGSFSLADTWQVRARLLGQHASGALVAGEQFGLGGVASVRGYGERELTGDSGLLLSLELESPEMLAATEPPSASLRFLAFGDVARAYNRGATPCLGTADRCSLASWGAGARYEQPGLQARLVVAQALRDAAQTRKDDARLHFSVNYAL